MLEYHERQIFTGPPENTRDHVMQAAKALAAGEWKKSSDLIHAITRFIDGWNERCQPFIWTKDADAIIAKGHRKSTFSTRH